MAWTLQLKQFLEIVPYKLIEINPKGRCREKEKNKTNKKWGCINNSLKKVFVFHKADLGLIPGTTM